MQSSDRELHGEAKEDGKHGHAMGVLGSVQPTLMPRFAPPKHPSRSLRDTHSQPSLCPCARDDHACCVPSLRRVTQYWTASCHSCGEGRHGMSAAPSERARKASGSVRTCPQGAHMPPKGACMASRERTCP
eukprot:7272209-Prymnesium_polylepis.1